ncbi:hypothetical protein [Paenibacillus larvae]|uniref:Uncharacterized protein n=25 Tax=root TaxID=1 RepID=A0A0C5AF54_9CAUD|nr:hypothetical protein [Paenibacillus larvae]YP_009203245.1 hypothetical protein FERN_43 [Paenibacillus phage Fern]YP_009203494.1 hypothetical protein AVV23_gp49 [Paenibacillus phage Sitara]YP_009593452.1 hypothetical protein FDG84_gp43 [Paenibacillus phage Willow]YP_009836309.1 hypothetical protein HWB43_gp52 [Paenibacillus phage BN12]YP_009836378.1 hypothetical protein HWB44_gp48 [Paenibacillus phage PBL1c]YP_009836458.1 hypothetical protein HWB45_gp49 [Paenibacillus phage Pagassa]YP_0098
MSLAQMLYKETGKKTGVVYATGMIKGREVRKMIEDCRAQETIPATAQSVYDQYLKVYQQFINTEDSAEAEMLQEDLKDMERKYGIGE